MKDLRLAGIASLAIASLLVAPALVGQQIVDRKLKDLVEALDTLLAPDSDRAALLASQRAAQDYVDALGKSIGRSAGELVLQELRRHESGQFLVTDAMTTRLLDEVRHQRTLGRPERMIPPLLVLESRYPDDARVLYALGEAFGIASPVFDAARAERCFRALLDALREPVEVATEPVGRARLLYQFLPELGRVGLLLEEAPIDTTSRLRQHLLGHCEKLADGRAIGLWKLADPQLDRLYEKLVVARRARDQTRCRELIEAMLAVQPVNPVLQYALCEVRVSLGPEFDRVKAAQHLDQFLDLTDPGSLGGPDAGRASVMSSADVVRDLGRFRLVEPRSDLEGQRVAAHELRARLDEKGFTPMLLVPDAGAIRGELRKLEPQLASKKKYFKIWTDKKAGFEAKLARLPSSAKSQRQDYLTEIGKCSQELQRLEADLEPLQQRAAELEGALK